ncbi:MAG TPA: galactokinase family protein [Acidimicrobiia bacterium]|nr:galactokinase family protein [Acidimicrobiia bacterium]
MRPALDRIRVRAPGRVNLIGDHTDYTGGLALPLAIDREVVVDGIDQERPEVTLTSDQDPEPASFSLPVCSLDPIGPVWARRVAAIAAEMGRVRGFSGSVTSTVPIGAGLSSSGALGVGIALALGAGDSLTRLEIALLCQRAQEAATGVPAGVLDEMASLHGLAGHAILLDCHDMTTEAVPLPVGAQIVVRYVSHRTVAGSPYSERVAACHEAETRIGPLRSASVEDVATIDDPILRKRARHVVSENQRVRDCAIALRAGDMEEAGTLMTASHISLRDDYEVSTPELDVAVESLNDTPGVHGARLTGAGFGGCVIALAEPGAVGEGWVVEAVDGAEMAGGAIEL